MGRPKKVGGPSFTLTAEPPNGENGEAPDAQTADALSSGGADEGKKSPKARIMRWNENLRQYATLDHVSAEAVDEQWIMHEYGGGKYLVYYWGTKKDGTYGYLEKQGKEFIIDDSWPFKGALKHRAATAPVQNPDGTRAGGTSMDDIMQAGVLGLLNTMQQANKAQTESFAILLERARVPEPTRSAVDWPAMITAITGILTPLLSLIGSRKDPVELATAIAALSRNEKSGLGSVHDLLELKDALALFGTNGDNEEGGWMRLLEKVVPGAIEILKQESAKTGKPLIALARQPAPARIGAPATAPSAAATSPSPASASSAGTPSPSPVPDAIQDEWTGLEPHVQTLAGFAQQNRDPYGVMQTIKTLAPAQMLAAVRELVARDDALDVLLQRFPVLQPYRAWTDQLLDEFFADFFPDADDEPPHDPNAVDESASDGVTS